jgi:hypothetical protein
MKDRTGEVNSRKEDYIDKVFIGTVEDINDPNKEGRCRIRIFGVHGGPEEIETSSLPWAYPGKRGTYFGKDGKAGSISIPKLNSVVTVRFNNGNVYAPEYYNIQELAEDIKEELNNEYEGTHIMLFDGDEDLKIWYTLEKGLTFKLGDAVFNLNKEEGISAILNDSVINIDNNNVVTVEAPSKVIVNSPNIELGDNAVESVIKGDSFKKFFDTHTHPSAGAPPAIPMPSFILSKNTKSR